MSRGQVPSVLRVVALRSNDGKYGGPADTAARQAELLADAGFEVSIMSGVTNVSPVHLNDVAGVRQAIIPSAFILADKFTLLFPKPSGFIRLVREVRAHEIVFVSFAREPIPILAAAVCALFKRRLIVQTHGMLTARRSAAHRLFDFFITRRLAKSAETVVALTEREREDLIRTRLAMPDQATVVGNPVAFPPSNFAKQDDLVVNIARLHPRKRPDVYVAAARHASLAGLAGSYTLIGPNEGELDSVLHLSAGLDNFRYLPPVDSREVLHWLARARAFVLCAQDEPWGNVLASAVAAGVPVVVAASAALASEVIDANLGLVFPDGDYQAIATHVDELIRDDKRYSEISENCREYADRNLGRAAVSARLVALLDR